MMCLALAVAAAAMALVGRRFKPRLELCVLLSLQVVSLALAVATPRARLWLGAASRCARCCAFFFDTKSCDLLYYWQQTLSRPIVFSNTKKVKVMFLRADLDVGY